MTQKQQVILRHLNGASNREIGRIMHMSKDTVNKYVNEYNEKRAELLAQDPAMEQSEIIQAFVEEPQYDCRSRSPRKSTEEAMTKIEKCLKLNEEKRARGMQKQQEFLFVRMILPDQPAKLDLCCSCSEFPIKQKMSCNA